MGERPAIDSRDYIVAFGLRSINDCPPDFDLPDSLAGFDTGLFLPRGDRDWFGRPLYPPRVLLLKSGTLHIVSHPGAAEPPFQCAMERISSVESGQMLLKGWLRFSGSGFDYTVRYNTRGFRAVFRFMRSFRDKLLRDALPDGTSSVRLGAGLDIKFTNALARELDSGETIATQFFQPAKEVKSRWWLDPRRRWMAGDLLALTGKRLLWITDRERGSYSRYGSVASYAPLGAVRTIDLASAGGGRVLRIDPSPSPPWVVPLAPGFERVAGEFAAALEIRRRRNEASRTEEPR
jgi:hypothetical protein